MSDGTERLHVPQAHPDNRREDDGTDNFQPRTASVPPASWAGATGDVIMGVHAGQGPIHLTRAELEFILSSREATEGRRRD